MMLPSPLTGTGRRWEKRMTASTVVLVILGLAVAVAWGLLIRDSVLDRDRGL